MDQRDQNGQYDDIELGMREVGTEVNGKSNYTATLIIIGIILVTVIAGIICLYESRKLTFVSNDKAISLKTSSNWIGRIVMKQDVTEDTFSVVNLSIYKNESRIYPSQINVMRVVTDVSGDSPQDLYSTWKENYQYNSLMINRDLQEDSSAKAIPDSSQLIDIPGYEAQQVEFGEKTNLGAKVSHFTTIVRSGTNCFIIDGICPRARRDSFFKEYNSIIETLKPCK